MIINQAVLLRPVGGPAVMAEQLARLLEVTQQANVSVRVLPWSAGVHGGMGASAPFVIMDFPVDSLTGEPLEPALAYVDTLTGAMYLNKASEVSAYRLAWRDLQERALDEAGSRETITSAMKGLADGSH